MFRDFDPESNLPIDPNDPSTWTLHADSTVDIGGTSTRRVSYDVALANRKRKYQELLLKANSSTGYAHGPQNMISANTAALMDTMYNPISRSGYAYGYDSKMFPTRDKVSSLFDAVLGNYYKDIYEGMDPFDAAVKHAQNLPYSEPVKQGVIDIINYDRNPVLDEKNDYVGRPNTPVIPEEEFNKLVEVEQLKKNPNFNVPESAVNEPKVVATEKANSPVLHKYESTYNNLFGSKTVPSDSLYPDINANFGWKLHTDLRKELSLEESLGKLGLSPKIGDSVRAQGGNLPPLNRLDLEVIDQDLFDTFKNKFHTLVGGSPFDNEDEYFEVARNIINTTRNYQTASFNLDGTPRKFTNPDELFEFLRVIGENDFYYKMDYGYGPGKEFTFYSKSLERRDRMISILESEVGEYLQDMDDPAFKASVIAYNSDTEAKNAPISQKFTGRFNTEYMNLQYQDEKGLPFLDITEQSSKQSIDRIPRIPSSYDPATKVPKIAKYITGGQFDSLKDVERLKEIIRDIPVLGEFLLGKDGYVSPYKTIEDIIEYRIGERVQLRQQPVDYPPSTSLNTVANPVVDQSLRDAVEEEIANGRVAQREAARANAIDPKNRSQTPSKPGPVLKTAGPEGSQAWIGGPPPQPNPKRNPILDVGSPVPSPTQVSGKVVTTGTGTPQPVINTSPPAANVTAQVTTNISAPPSSGAPLRGSGTAGALANARQSAAAVTQGVSGAKNLKMLGVAALVGLGAGGVALSRKAQRDSRTQQDNIDRRLEMQRRGIIS